MSATYSGTLMRQRSHLQPADVREAGRPGASRLELIAAWKERHGQVDMHRISGLPRPRGNYDGRTTGGASWLRVAPRRAA